MNDNPVARDDEFNTNEDTLLTNMEVLTNDDDVDNPASDLSISDWTQPSCGTVGVVAYGGRDKAFTFMPAANFNGDCTFSYQVTDNVAAPDTGYSTAKVTVHVTPSESHVRASLPS